MGVAGVVGGVAGAVVVGVGCRWGWGGGGCWFGFVAEERHGFGLEGSYLGGVIDVDGISYQGSVCLGQYRGWVCLRCQDAGTVA